MNDADFFYLRVCKVKTGLLLQFQTKVFQTSQLMKRAKSGAYVFSLGLVPICFFGLGLWDRNRIEDGKEPDFALTEHHTDNLSVYPSFLYAVEVEFHLLHVSDIATRPHETRRLRADKAIKFEWNFWTLGLALLLAGLGAGLLRKSRT